MNAELDEMMDGIARLISALDGRDPHAIELANQGLTLSVDRLRALGGWRDTYEELTKLEHALAMAEAARVRVNLLSDMTQRQVEMLIKARENAPESTAYNRNGRRRRAAV